LSGKSDGGHTVRLLSFYALVQCSSLIFPEEKEGLLNKTGAKFHNIVEIAG
jgi:hypothetical protein